MPLQQPLSLRAVIVNHTCVRGAEEDLMTIGGGQIVHSLIDVLVEANHVLQVLHGKVIVMGWERFLPMHSNRRFCLHHCPRSHLRKGLNRSRLE